MSERTTTRRRQLGAMMRKLRARKGLTLEEAGQLVGISKATVSRYKTQAGPGQMDRDRYPVPGLLQTCAYSTALQRANEVHLEPAEIERLVDIRKEL